MIRDEWVEIRRDGRLLFRYDPTRDLIEIKIRGFHEPVIIDLKSQKVQETTRRPARNVSRRV